MQNSIAGFPLKIFCLTVPKKFPRWNLLCFRKDLVSKNVKDKRERGHHDFTSKTCCLTYRKRSYRNPSVFQKVWVSKKFMPKRVMSRFSVEPFFCLAEPKNFEELFCFTKILVSKNNMDERERRRGAARISIENLSDSTDKNYVEEPFCVLLLSGIEKC